MEGLQTGFWVGVSKNPRSKGKYSTLCSFKYATIMEAGDWRLELGAWRLEELRVPTTSNFH